MSETPNTQTQPVVVGVDGSEASKDALRWAVRQAVLVGAEVHAIYAWRVPNTFYGGGVPSVLERDLSHDSQTELDEIITEVVGERPAHLVAKAVEGHAAPTLVDASEYAQLLVVGSRGRGAFAGMLLGSISDYCVSHAACPVVVVRHHGE